MFPERLYKWPSESRRRSRYRPQRYQGCRGCKKLWHSHSLGILFDLHFLIPNQLEVNYIIFMFFNGFLKGFIMYCNIILCRLYERMIHWEEMSNYFVRTFMLTTKQRWHQREVQVLNQLMGLLLRKMTTSWSKHVLVHFLTHSFIHTFRPMASLIWSSLVTKYWDSLLSFLNNHDFIIYCYVNLKIFLQLTAHKSKINTLERIKLYALTIYNCSLCHQSNFTCYIMSHFLPNYNLFNPPLPYLSQRDSQFYSIDVRNSQS